MKEIDLSFRSSELRNTSDVDIYVNQLVLCYSKMKEAYRILKPFKLRDSEFQDMSPEDYSYSMLDYIEEIIIPGFDFSVVEKYARQAIGGLDSTIRRLKDSYYNMRKVKPLLENAVDEYTPLEDSMIETMSTLSYQAVGNLNRVLLADIKIEEAYTSSKEGEMVIPHSLVVSLTQNDLDINDFVVEVVKDKVVYEPVENIFDKYPELEEPFYDVLGLYISDIEELEHYVTLEEVKQIISSGGSDKEAQKVKDLIVNIKSRIRY